MSRYCRVQIGLQIGATDLCCTCAFNDDTDYACIVNLLIVDEECTMTRPRLVNEYCFVCYFT